MTSKNPEQIMEEFVSKKDIFNTITREEIDWLRSSLASVLLWAAKELPKKKEYCRCMCRENEDKRIFNDAITDCRSLLIEKAKEITKEQYGL